MVLKFNYEDSYFYIIFRTLDAVYYFKSSLDFNLSSLNHFLPPSHHQWEADSFVHQQNSMFCWLATSLHPSFLVKPHWKQINELSSHIRRRPKGKKNEIGAKRLREEKCSPSFFGPVHGGFCLSEQLLISGEPDFCTSAPNLDNLVLSVVVLEFFIFFSLILLVTMSQVKISHSL